MAALGLIVLTGEVDCERCPLTLPLSLLSPQLLDPPSLLRFSPFLLHPCLLRPHGSLYLCFFMSQPGPQLLPLLLQARQVEGLVGWGAGLVVVVLLLQDMVVGVKE